MNLRFFAVAFFLKLLFNTNKTAINLRFVVQKDKKYYFCG